MKTSRREWLKRAGIASAGATLLGCGESADGPLVCADPALVLPTDLPQYAYEGPLGPLTMFRHGVASGDPLPDAVILWTRLSPESESTYEVFYEVAVDSAFTQRIVAGTFTTSAARDYSVKVDAAGLVPARTFYYRFHALGRTSPVGRTRTAPLGETRHLRFGVVSCGSYAAGYFHAYRNLAARADLDAVLHLGDYIYETGSATVRPHDPPREIISLEDYRLRYSQYRLDPDLAELHRQNPFIVVWDDHETTNNAWRDGAGNHDDSEGSYADRRAAAAQAYSEWMPIRDQPSGVIYRTLRYGDLMDLFMLDTRIVGRDQQLTSIGMETEGRTLLGAEQEAWLAGELTSSTARWRVLGQQVMMGQLGVNMGAFLLNLDQWDGYPHARGRLLDVIEGNGIDNVVVLTGDIHSSWANEIVRDPWRAYDPATSAGALAVEFVTPSVTSSGLSSEGNETVSMLALRENPHVKYVNAWAHGYALIDVKRERVQCDFFHVDGVEEGQGVEAFSRAFSVKSGRARLREETEPAPDRVGCVLAPET